MQCGIKMLYVQMEEQGCYVLLVVQAVKRG